MEDFAAKMRRTIASRQAGRCGCRECVSERNELRVCMSVCPVCGERRCPKLSDHREACANVGEAAAAPATAAPAGDPVAS